MDSSKSFILLITAITACLGVIGITAGLLYEWIILGSIATDLTQLSLYVGALAAFVGAGSLTKMSAERKERKEKMETKE